MKMMINVLAFTLLITCAMSPTIGYGAGADSSEIVTNRIIRLEGFMRTTRIISLDQSKEEKLTSIAPRMRKVRELNNEQGGPVTIEEASEHLRQYISMAVPPAVCVEYNGVFFFSWDRSSGRAEDFSSGFAIVKGQRAIYSWDKADDDAGKEGARESRP